MRIAVVGVGGVGGYFGGGLAAAGEDVVFVARGENLGVLQERGLVVESIAGDVVVEDVRATDRLDEVGAVDVVVLGVKAWQVAGVAPTLRPLLRAGGFVLPLQNGIDAPYELADALGPGHVVGGLCTIIALRAGPGHVRHVGGAPRVVFGDLEGATVGGKDALLDAFGRAGIDAHITDDIEAALWEKFMMITAFGGVGGVTRRPIGAVRDVPESRALLEGVIGEIAAVARARGVAIPADAEARAMTALEKFEAHSTASMQRDIAEGRPSELDQLTGTVVRLGAASGVDVPVNTFIYASLLPAERAARSE